MRRISAIAAVCIAGAFLPSNAYAQLSSPVFDTSYRILSLTAESLERALARRSAVVDENHAQLAPAVSLSALFPQYGFAVTHAFVSQSLHPLDADRVRGCLSVQVSNIEQWGALVSLARKRGYARANPACVPQGSWAVPPASWPSVEAAVFEHDRRRVPTPTRRTPGVVVEGLPERETQAAYVLSGNTQSLVVVNPASAWEGTCSSIALAPTSLQPALSAACAGVAEALRPTTPATAGYWLQQLAVDAGPGLVIPPSGTCATLAPGQSCTYTVSGQASQGKRVFAALRLQWQRVPIATAGGSTAELSAASVERVLVGFEKN